MSAPHPKARDDANPLSWFGRKPPEQVHAEHTIEILSKRHCKITETESELMPTALQRTDEEVGTQQYETRPLSATGAARIDPIDEIAHHMRSLTWREMMDLSEAWNTPADILHRWAVGHGQ